MSQKPFDFSALELTYARVNEIAQGYISQVTVKNYYTNEILFDSSLNKHFVDFMSAYTQCGEIEKDEKWVTEYLGFEGNGWQHVKQKLYKHHNKYNSQLHLVIDLNVKKKGLFSTDRRKKYGFWKQFFLGFLGVDLANHTLLSNNGKHGFLPGAFVGYLILKHFEKENRKAVEDGYKFDDR